MKNEFVELMSKNPDVLFLGLGNPMRKDDGVGLYIAKNLSTKYSVIEGGKNPEECLSKIVEEKPDLILVLDTVDQDGSPGDVYFFDEEEVGAKRISSHRMPLPIFFDILKEKLGEVDIYLIGIQPKDLSIEQGLSKEIRETADILLDLIQEVIG